MKLFDSTKKKVVAGVTAVTLVSGVGVSFAATDVGTQLKSWYDGQFNETVEKSFQDGEDYARGKLPEMEEEYNKRKDNASDSLDITRDYQIDKVSDNINSAKQSHLDNLEDTKKELLEGAGIKFHEEFVNGVEVIEGYTQQGMDYINSDVPEFMKGKGNEAIEDVERDLDEVKDEAVTALEAAIKNAKTELREDLDDRGDNLSKNFETQINHGIEDLRKETGKVVNEALDKQQDLIAEAAAEKGTEAEKALDAVVEGMNN